jgi:DNA-directed RNA polymerase II subunit RPB2
VLADLFLPHVGEVNFSEKAYYLGYIVNEMLAVYTGAKEPTDRDSYKYKRIEPVGVLLRDLFREYFVAYTAKLRRGFETKYEFNKASYADISALIELTQEEVFEDFGGDIVNTGIKKAFKGSWGGTPQTKRVGVVQDLNRLSFLGYISHLRKTNLPLDASVKLIGPRILHGSQWGIIDAIDTPDGGNIGIHKHLAITTYVTRTHSRESILEWLRNKPKEIGLVPLSDSTPVQLGDMVKIMVNGYWAGSVHDPIRASKYMRDCRRQGLLPASTSIAFDIPAKTIMIFNDGGRLCRPIFYRDELSKEFPFGTEDWSRLTSSSSIDRSSWTELITGFNTKKNAEIYDPMQSTIYEWEDLYTVSREGHIGKRKAILEYIDTSESEYTKIALNQTALSMVSSYDATRFTHHELHESTGYGVMCNLINYLEHNPVVRNSFSCGQAKQACSVYHTNYDLRMDKTAVVLNNGQNPLVKSRYLQYITNEENPNGVNAIVAIACYTGYNVEDAILVNEGALQRGLFRTTYYSTYEAHEEKTVKGDTTYLKSFANIDRLISENGIAGTKPEYDFSQLDSNGLIRENTYVTEKTALIGMAAGFIVSSTDAAAASSTEMSNSNKPSVRRDASKTAKKGQMGVVDRSFMTEGEEGQRIAKVRLREERIPAVGDKMASRAGQKGTVGNIVSEQDMPFTADGIRPDMIINPHALPSRMTIGQLVECLAGKAVAMYGSYADCTAFTNLRMNAKAYFGALLSRIGFNSNGDEIMYSGTTGEQIKCSIFIGPTYYMRLKHMVKDKINFRARGPNANITRQPVGGRANDGGLRIGEMERDSILAHGTAGFLTDSMMERGDKYHMAVCNTTGTIAVYNPSEKLMYSIAADGPVRYKGSLATSDTETNRIQQITKYGRKFSIVEIPYSLKLLMQELQAIGVRMRLITEDNVSQIDNLAGSHTMELATGVIGITPQLISDTIRKKLHRHAEHRTETSTRNYNETVHTAEKRPADKRPADKRMVGGEELTSSFEPFDNNNDKEQTDLPNFEDLDGGNFGPNLSIYSPDKIDYSHLTGGTATELMNIGFIPKEGDVVHFRGDSISSRLWTVQHVGNHNKITIQTNDSRNLNTEDTILYVDASDIYPPEIGAMYAAPQYVQHTSGFNDSNRLFNDGNSGFNGCGLNTGGGPGPIHFAPVVKIFNQGGVDTTEPNSSMNGGNSSEHKNVHMGASIPIPQILGASTQHEPPPVGNGFSVIKM